MLFSEINKSLWNVKQLHTFETCPNQVGLYYILHRQENLASDVLMPVRRWYLRLNIKSTDSLIPSHQAFTLIDKAKKYSNIQDVAVHPKNVRTMLDFSNLGS